MVKKKKKLPIHTDLDALDVYCEFVLNDKNKYINFSNLTNLRDYIAMIDEEEMKSNESKLARYLFLKFYLEARLDRGIINRKLCLNYVFDHCSPKYQAIIKKEIIKSLPQDQLSKKDIEFINSMVFTQLNLSFMHMYKEPLTKFLEDVDNNNFGKDSVDCDNGIRFLQAILTDMTKAQRRSRQENRFNLTDKEHFKAVMVEAAERALSDSQYWKTGWQGMNSMLNGGFENGRIYNFIGATGGFKSGLLLNIMKQIKMYNKGQEHKDPTKRPTILFLSQENNLWETIYRIFGIFGTTENIRKFSVNEIVDIMANGGFNIVSDEIDSYISGKRDIIQDYIERLRPPIVTAEKRIQLFDISNQLHDLAVDLDVPIITGSQFNRSGVATIEDLQASNKKDIGKNVGSKDVSESFAMLKNFDVNIAIVVEYDSNEERFYLSFRSLKFRGDDTDTLKYFLQPFVGKNSKIQLMDDLNTDPVYRLSMVDELNAQIADESDKLKTISRRKVKNILDPTIDIDQVDADEFLNSFNDDINHSKVSQDDTFADDFMRDDEGFIVMLWSNKPVDMSGLAGLHISESF